ncbi:MAG: thioredoxin family protein [Candidatus Bipolaricaulia bacterium]
MVKLQILESPGCAKCASAKQSWERIKDDYPQVEAEAIDITEHPELAVEHGLMSTPGIVIDGELKASGFTNEQRLRELLDEAIQAREPV